MKDGERGLTTNTAEETSTDKYTVVPEEHEWDEGVLDMLRDLPRTFPDLPYPEDDDL